MRVPCRRTKGHWRSSLSWRSFWFDSTSIFLFRWTARVDWRRCPARTEDCPAHTSVFISTTTTATTFIQATVSRAYTYHQNNVGLRVQSSGYGHALLLPAAQGYTPFADNRPLFVRQYVDVRAQCTSVHDPLEPRLVVLVAEHDVLQDRSVQQPRPLRHVRHTRASFQVHLAEQTVHFAEHSEQHRRLAATDFTGYYRQFTCARLSIPIGVNYYAHILYALYETICAGF